MNVCICPRPARCRSCDRCERCNHYIAPVERPAVPLAVDPTGAWTDAEAARITAIFDDLDARFADDWPGAS